MKRILAEDPQPPWTHRRFPPYHAITNPSQRRLAIVRLHVEGWNAKSIAGMPDKSRAPHRPATKVTLRATCSA